MSSTRVLTPVYRRAMRHKSMEDNTNERLEYLGDSVIALTVSPLPSRALQGQNEGFFDETQNATGIRGHLRKTGRRDWTELADAC
jgi:hypothetical protein